MKSQNRENQILTLPAAKTKPPEPEKFFIDLRSDSMTRITSEEELPVLGSPEQRLTIKGPDEKTKATSDQIENDRWIDYSQKAYKVANTRSLASMTRTTMKIIKIQNRMKKLQSEENEEDKFNQEEETYEDNDGDNYNPEVQEEETNEKNEISFDGHPEIELAHTQASRALPKISRMSDICMDRPKYATLVCGHRYCYQCASLQMQLDERVCAICRRCICL